MNKVNTIRVHSVPIVWDEFKCRFAPDPDSLMDVQRPRWDTPDVSIDWHGICAFRGADDGNGNRWVSSGALQCPGCVKG